ncbi:MAG TPA: hypothetical protein PKX92_08035 [Edaphocola sp.]|nr:hypothetical protein [Edaphocola sp.]
MLCFIATKRSLASLVLIFCFFINNNVHAKDGLENKNAFALEIGGSHLLYSFQYERMVWHKENKRLNLRMGLGYSFFGDNMFISKSPNISWSISPNLLLGKERNKVEFSLGYTIFNGFYKPQSASKYKIYPDHYFNGQIAYRYYFEKEKFYFKAGGVLLMRAFYFNTYKKHYPGGRAPDAFVPLLPFFTVGLAYCF